MTSAGRPADPRACVATFPARECLRRQTGAACPSATPAPSALFPDGPPSPHPPPPRLQQNIAQMSRMLPPHMLKMMGGPAAIQSLLKQMEGKF